MTRRKRTPPPPSSSSSTTQRGAGNKRVTFADLPAGVLSNSSFQFPASLAKLSSLSASLARSADAPRELQNSEIVARAQALVDGPLLQQQQQQGQQQQETVLPASAAAAAAADKGSKPAKELKWKTGLQKDFPEEQTWVQSVSNYSTAGHARALQTKYAAAAATVTAVKAEVERERLRKLREQQQKQQVEKRNGNGNVAVANAGAVQEPQQRQAQQQAQPQPQIVDPRSLDTRNSTSRYQVRMDGRVTFVEPPRTMVVQQQQQQQPVVEKNGTATADEGSAQNGKKRKHIEFVEKHQKVFPTQQTWVKPPPPTAKQGYGSSTGQPVSGEPMSAADIEARRRAIIANLTQNGQNAPAGPVFATSRPRGGSRSASVGSAHHPRQQQQQQRKDRPTSATSQSSSTQQTQQQQQQQATAPRPPSPPALEYSKNQQEIADLIAKKRAENAASGQQQRLLQLRLQHQEKVQRARPPPIVQGQFYFGGPVAGLGSPMMMQQQTPTPTPAPLVGIAAAATQGLNQRGASHGGDEHESDDEDAPGEDEESPVRQSIEDANGVGQYSQSHHLVTDPGDLGSLFTSREDDASPAQTRAHTRHYGGGGGGVVSLGGYDGMHAAASGYGPAQPEGHVRGMTDDKDDEQPMSPSAQLLMALANATPPPSWDVPVQHHHQHHQHYQHQQQQQHQRQQSGGRRSRRG